MSLLIQTVPRYQNCSPDLLKPREKPGLCLTVLARDPMPVKPAPQNKKFVSILSLYPPRFFHRADRRTASPASSTPVNLTPAPSYPAKSRPLPPPLPTPLTRQPVPLELLASLPGTCSRPPQRSQSATDALAARLDLGYLLGPRHNRSSQPQASTVTDRASPDYPLPCCSTHASAFFPLPLSALQPPTPPPVASGASPRSCPTPASVCEHWDDQDTVSLTGCCSYFLPCLLVRAKNGYLEVPMFSPCSHSFSFISLCELEMSVLVAIIFKM
jgi:hypothetical protein